MNGYGYRKLRAADFRAKAREALKGNWGIAICAMLLASILGAFATLNLEYKLPDGLDLRATDLLNPSFYTVENLQTILSRFSPLVAGFALFATVFSASASFLFSLFVGAPIKAGYEKFNLQMIDGQKPDIKLLFALFKNGYLKSVCVKLLMKLIELAYSIPLFAVAVIGGIVNIAALKMLISGELPPDGGLALLIGFLLVTFVLAILTVVLLLVVNYRYRFAYLILAEYPEISATDALRNSKSLMKGNKWRLFCLQLSFLGWGILCLFTCGIGYLWLTPYMAAAETAFYDSIANRNAAKEAVFPSLNPDDYLTEDKKSEE